MAFNHLFSCQSLQELVLTENLLTVSFITPLVIVYLLANQCLVEVMDSYECFQH